MRDECHFNDIGAVDDRNDFSRAGRGALILSPGRTRITIMLDDDAIEASRSPSYAGGVGCPTPIDALLRKGVTEAKKAGPEARLRTLATGRRVLREALPTA